MKKTRPKGEFFITRIYDQKVHHPMPMSKAPTTKNNVILLPISIQQI